jgi:DNA recombination protein RmuC
MAEDQLARIGFLEGINYRKRTATEEGIPDFTILMPRERLLHIDVKFPLDNYLAHLDADDDLEQKRAADAFRADVRRHVKDLAERGYHHAADAVDFTLMYIPVESVYAFVHEQDPRLVDDALREGIVFCSPSTLFGNLTMVRQAIESFNLQEATHEVLDLLAKYVQQHRMFTEEFAKVERSLDSTRKQFDTLAGTRAREIGKLADRIQAVRRQRAELRSVTDDEAEADPETEFPPALEA